MAPKVLKVNGVWKVVSEEEWAEAMQVQKMAEAYALAQKDDDEPAVMGAGGGMALPPGLQASISGSIGGTFVLANEGITPRLVVAVDALEKQGKTHFALTAPGPIAYQSTDIGTEGVIQKFQHHKKIYLAEYGFTIAKDDTQPQIMAKAGAEWDKFTNDWRMVAVPGLKTKKLRSVVWDTGSELWEFERLARLGKLTQVMPHHYTALNQEYTQLIKEVYQTPGNLVILHKLKAEWKDNAQGKGNKTGAYERSGFAGTGFLVQVNVTAWRDNEGEFHITVKDCRQNPAIAGQDFVGPLAEFKFLAVAVYPHTKLEDWE